MTKLTRWALRYGVAVLAVVTALALLAIPGIGKGLASVLYLAVFIAARYGGLGPGLLATALITTIALLDHAFKPDFPLWQVVGILLFAGGGVLITLLVEALQAARRRAEASQQWLTAVLTSIGDAVITADAQGRVTFLNPVARHLTGWETEEAVGSPVTDIFRIVNEETRAAVEDPVSRVLREGIVVGLANHTVLITRDGTERPIDDRGAPIKEQGGAITGAVLVFRDVTQRRQIEAMQARLAAIVESSNDAIIGKDLDGVITSWNSSAERIFGYAAEEIVGRPMDLLIPADRRAEESETLARLRRGERLEHFEAVRITKDGRSIDVATTASPIRDGTGRIIGASRIIRDITQRRRDEEQLRDRERMLAQSQRMAHVGSWELEWDMLADRHRGALRWSDECYRIFGYEPGQVAVNPDLFLRAVHPDDRDAVMAAVDQALRENRPYAIEHRITRPDGTERVVFEWGEIVADSSGRPIRIVGSCQDVTEWKRTEEVLRQAAQQMEALSRRLIRAEEDERRRIARELHDETGQALTAVKMYLQGVVQGLDDPAEVRAGLDESIRLVEQTLGQVRSISLNLRPALLDDLGLVAALQSLVKRQAQLAGFAARFVPVADPLAFRLEPELETTCFRVVQEALTNVVRHAVARTVAIELQLGERALRVCVRDDGTGFDPAAARSRAASGVSLGVLSMEERVKLVGGRFAIRSMPGQGTEVSAEFPLTPRPSSRS